MEEHPEEVAGIHSDVVAGMYSLEGDRPSFNIEHRYLLKIPTGHIEAWLRRKFPQLTVAFWKAAYTQSITGSRCS